MRLFLTKITGHNKALCKLNPITVEALIAMHKSAQFLSELVQKVVSLYLKSLNAGACDANICPQQTMLSKYMVLIHVCFIIWKIRFNRPSAFNVNASWRLPPGVLVFLLALVVFLLPMDLGSVCCVKRIFTVPTYYLF